LNFIHHKTLAQFAHVLIAQHFSTFWLKIKLIGRLQDIFIFLPFIKGNLALATFSFSEIYTCGS